MDAGGRGFGGTDLGEGTFAGGGSGQITRVSVGQCTVFVGFGRGLPGGLVKTRGRGFGGGTSQTSLHTVLYGLGGRRGASRRKAVVAWVSVVFDHFHSRQCSGKSSGLLGSVLDRLGGGRSASGR